MPRVVACACARVWWLWFAAKAVQISLLSSTCRDWDRSATVKMKGFHWPMEKKIPRIVQLHIVRFDEKMCIFDFFSPYFFGFRRFSACFLFQVAKSAFGRWLGCSFRPCEYLGAVRVRDDGVDDDGMMASW